MIEILPPTAGADSGYSCPLMDEVSALAERERRLGEVLRGVQSRLAQREQEASRDLQMVKECAARLEQEILAARSAARDPNHISDKDYQQLVGHIREIVHHNIPAGRTVAVVSRGDGDLLEFDGRQGWHFPQTEDGTYAGHHPADSADAIEQLQALVGRGAEFLLFPATAVWWLSHYGDLRAHLEAHGERVWADRFCVIYRLTTGGREASEEAVRSSRRWGAFSSWRLARKRPQPASVVAAT